MLTKSDQEFKEVNNSETIYTIGHSNLYDHQLFKLLHQHGITVVADVRSSPRSQYVPQFNRVTFSRSLLDAGFDYQFMGNMLGGRPEDRTCYFAHEIPDGHADYLHLVDYEALMTKPFFLEGIQKLKTILESDRVALMCSEENPNQCHRHHLIGKYLLRQGYDVKHIRKDGSLVGARQLPDLPKKDNSQQLGLFG